MAITASYGFDGTINEAQWSTLHAPVNPGHVEGMAASVGSGTREIDVASGTAWAVGTYHVASATTVALSANSSGNTRIDTIVVNINFSTDTATVTAVEGTPAATPARPTLTQTAGTQWQIPLCHVTVVDGETAFSSADIVDARPSSAVYPAAVITKNGNQSTNQTNGSWFTVIVTAGQYQGNIAAGSSGITIYETGLYRVTVSQRVRCTSTGSEQGAAATVGSTQIVTGYAYGALNENITCHGSALVRLTAGNVIVFQMYGTGNDITIYGGGTHESALTVEYIGP